MVHNQGVETAEGSSAASTFPSLGGQPPSAHPWTEGWKEPHTKVRHSETTYLPPPATRTGPEGGGAGRLYCQVPKGHIPRHSSHSLH